MKKYKWFVATALISSLILSACGTDKEEETNEQVVEEKEVIDLSKEAESFKSFAIEQVELFVEDAQLLEQYLKENKLEEAQKLFPLVRMYVERLQPLRSNFIEEFAVLDGKVEKGKESELAGFAQVEKSLFADKSTAAALKDMEEVVKATKALATKLETATLDAPKMFADTETMLNALEAQLNGREVSYVAIDVYEAKANVEAVEQMVAAFMSRAETASAAKLTEETTAMNKVIEFYEVGKEDYIMYDIFTKSQKEELIAAVKNVKSAYQNMKATIK